MPLIGEGLPGAGEVWARARQRIFEGGFGQPQAGASERIARGQPSKVLNWVNSKIPVPFLQEVLDDQPSQREVPDPEVGARWGRPADLAFSLPDSSLGPKQEEPPEVVVEDNDEVRVFDGMGVRQATDHFGAVVAESPPLDENNYFGIYTVYFCGTFTEKSQEEKTLPTGVRVITPIETHVRQYVQFDAVTRWADLKHTYTFSHDEAPVPPGGNIPSRCDPVQVGPN
jgi:hypothetical protein